MDFDYIELLALYRERNRCVGAIRRELKKLSSDILKGWPDGPLRFSPLTMLADLHVLSPTPAPGRVGAQLQQVLADFAERVAARRRDKRKFRRLAREVIHLSRALLGPWGAWLKETEQLMEHWRRLAPPTSFKRLDVHQSGPAQLMVPPPVAVFNWRPLVGMVN